jgi:hypothetical protein
MTARSRNEPRATFKPAGNKETGLRESRSGERSDASIKFVAMLLVWGTFKTLSASYGLVKFFFA